jgi:hypothetical protein
VNFLVKRQGRDGNESEQVENAGSQRSFARCCHACNLEN